MKQVLYLSSLRCSFRARGFWFCRNNNYIIYIWLHCYKTKHNLWTCVICYVIMHKKKIFWYKMIWLHRPLYLKTSELKSPTINKEVTVYHLVWKATYELLSEGDLITLLPTDWFSSAIALNISSALSSNLSFISLFLVADKGLLFFSEA